MAIYTLSSLINSLVEFEQSVAKKLVGLEGELENKDLSEFVGGVSRRISELRDLKGFMVEMILEPIYGVDVKEMIDSIKSVSLISPPIEAAKKVLNIYIDLYSRLSREVYGVSMELSMLLERYMKYAYSILNKLSVE